MWGEELDKGQKAGHSLLSVGHCKYPVQTLNKISSRNLGDIQAIRVGLGHEKP